MSVWIWAAGNTNGTAYFQGATRYQTLRGGMDPQATETSVQGLIQGAFTLSNLYVRATSANGINTVRLRNNTFDQTNAVSVTGTGTFEDTTHTDALVAGDLVDTVVVIGGSHTNAATLTLVSYLADDGGNNSTFYQSSKFTSMTTGTYYMPVGGSPGANTTTEALAQHPVRVATTYSNLRVIVLTHGASADTIRTRITGGDGNQALSYASSETGAKEDTTNTDVVSVGELVAYQVVTGSSIAVSAPAMAGAATGDVLLTANDNSGGSPTANQTISYACGEGYTAGTATEANAQLKARTAQTLRNFFVNIGTNSRSDSTTIAVRVNGASSALTVSVGAGVTGITEDLSHSVVLATTDTINFRLAVGAGTGSITPSGFGVQQGGAAAAVAEALPVFPLWRARAPLYVR